MSEPVRGVVIAHASLAEALIGAVDRIVGLEEDVLIPVSNEGCGPTEIGKRIAAAVGDRPALLFTDLREGSCGIAALRSCRERPGQVLVTGVNLPMLLDFAMNRHRPLEELVERVLERGQNAIQRMPQRSNG